MNFSWINDVLTLWSTPVPQPDPPILPRPIVENSFNCDSCGCLMVVTNTWAHSGNKLIRRTFTCPRCNTTMVMDALARI